MKDFVWFAAIALLALPGTIVWRVPLIARMSRSARWAFAFIAGLLIAALLLYAYALLHIRWTRANIAVPLVIIAIISHGGQPTSAVRFSRGQPGSAVLHWITVLVTLYAVADARATCGDLMYIWGPKAQAFYTARTISPSFLAFPFYTLMHPDYPPLVPLVYDVGSIFAHSWSWWAPLFLALLMLVSIVGVLRGFGAPQRAATLLMAVLSFAFVAAYLPGAADPFLLLFESVALIALTFAPDSQDARWIAATALAGGAFSKVEGATFAIIVAIAFVLTQRRIRQALVMLIPAAVLLGSWLLFAAHYKLLDQYARAHTPMYWNRLSTVLNDVIGRASYRVFWLPWIAAAAPLFVSKSWRRAALPLLVAAGSIASTIFFYLHNPDPSFWIATSAERILVTPLMCIAVASTACWDPVEPDRLADAPIGVPA